MTSEKCWKCVDEIVKGDSYHTCELLQRLSHETKWNIKEDIETEKIAGSFPDEWYKELALKQKVAKVLKKASDDCWKQGVKLRKVI
jgi:hypothetical protein